MSPKEIQQLGNLLLSSQPANISLALTILEKNSVQITAISAQALVYYFCSYQSPNERLSQIAHDRGAPAYFMTQEGRELEPRELLREWLEQYVPDFSETQHELYFLTHRNWECLHQRSASTVPPLPSLSRLQNDLAALPFYRDYLEQRASWGDYYYKYANYLKYSLDRAPAQEFSSTTRWEYQKICLAYLRLAQQHNPENNQIALDIASLLHKQGPAPIITEDYAQEVIDNYLMAAYIPDPTVPLSGYVASYSYIDLADFYYNSLQQHLPAHHYYQKSLTLAPDNDRAKLAWAALLEEEGATERAEALRATVDPGYDNSESR